MSPPPIILLHPFPLDGRFWEPTLGPLAARTMVYAPHFPGFGATGADLGAAPSIAAVADGLARWIVGAAAGGRAIVAGVSMGGYLALSLAARHPERVAGLVLADTHAAADDPPGRAGRHDFAARARSGDLQGALDGLLPRLVADGNPDALARARNIADHQHPEAVARAQEAMAERADHRADLPRLSDLPAILLRGEHDAVTPQAAMDEMAVGLGAGPVRTIPGAGHLAPLERPEAFIVAALEVVRRLAGPA